MIDVKKALVIASKVITATRDMTAASGNVAYSGVGFKPKAIIALAVINGSTNVSIGFSDSALTEDVVYTYPTNWSYDPHLVHLTPSGGNSQHCTMVSMDADGFTLAWTLTGAPTGTANLFFLCLK